MSGDRLMPKGPGSFGDASLDEYCERLNAAFEELRKASSSEPAPDPARLQPMGSDSLESYLDRLTDAFDRLARARGDRVEVMEESPPASAVTVAEAVPDTSLSAAEPASTIEAIEEPEPIEVGHADEAVEVPPAFEATQPDSPVAPVTVTRPRARRVSRKKSAAPAKRDARARKRPAAAPKAGKRSRPASRKPRRGR